MKKVRLFAALLLLFSLALLCAGCTPNLEAFENMDSRLHTESILDALIADDFQSAYTSFSNICSESEFTTIFQQMQELVLGTEKYGLKLLQIQNQTSIINSAQTKTIYSTYEMMSDSGRMIIDIVINEDSDILSFYITPYEHTGYYVTGMLANMEDATAVQWVFLVLNIIPLGFTIYAVVDCCRQKIRKKALWIIWLLLGFATIGFTLSASSVRLNFNLGWLTGYTSLIRYGSGAMVVRFMLPAAAISYFAARKTLLQKAAAESAPNEEYPIENNEATKSADSQSIGE